MAINGGKIEFGVGFNVDKTGLKDIKDSFLQIQQLTPQNLLEFNQYSGTSGKQLQQAKKDLEVLKVTAGQVQTAFENAFNPVTGLTNLQQLNTSLRKIGMENISKAFAKGGDIGNQAFYKIAKGALTTNMQLRQTNTLLDKMGQTLGNTIKWGISSSIMNKFVGSVQQAYGYVQHLDTSLNDIRIVTGKSADEMDKFAVKANNAAKALGSSTTEYTEAALIYYQQGLSDEESQARAETTLKAANVTGQSGQAVSEQLTAVWNGYKVTAEETELYVDKLAAVAASTAADLEELSTGMSKVASAANNMGVDIDQLNAQLATIVSVTRQAPETAGTALKTIYARMEDLKIGGEDESGVKLGEVSSTLEAVGVSIMDTQGDLRNLGEVIEEVAGKWNTWTSAQQNAIAQALAGKRQYNNLLALFDNWDMYTDALETSKNATGTLQKQQDIYMESTAAHLQQLKTAWEDFYDSLINTDDINSVLDVFTDLVEGMARFLDGIGGGRNALLMFGSTLTSVFSKQISAGITNVIQGLGRIKTNAAELEAQLNNIQLFKTSEQYNTYKPVQVLIDSMKEISQYYKILNNDQINYANSLAQQAADAKELEVQWENNTAALRSFQEGLKDIVSAETGQTGAELFPKIAGQTFNADDIRQIQLRTDALNEQKDSLQIFTETYENMASTISRADKKVNDNQAKTIEIRTQEWKDLTEQVDIAQISFENFNKLHLLDNVDPDTLDRVKQSLQGMQNAVKNHSFSNLETELENFDEAVRDLAPSLQDLLSKLLQVNETASNMDFSAPAKRLQQFLQQANMQNFINNLTTGLAAIGQFGSGLISLSNTFDMLGDSSLSTKEKIIQFISSFGMGLSMLISSAVQLPQFITGLQQVPQAIQKINLGFTAWATNLDAVGTAEKVLDDLNDQQINALFKRAGIQKLANDELTKEEALLVLDQAAKEGDTTATEALSGAMTGLIAKIKAYIISLGTAKIVMLAAVAAFAAMAVAASAVSQVHAKAAKNALEAADAQYKAAKENSEALQTEYENVKRLVDAYKELKEEYGADQTDELKQHIYELSQEYGVHIDMIALMQASYEELDGIMTALLQDISGQDTAASLEVVNAHLDAIVAKMNSVQAEEDHPLLNLFMTISNLTDVIAENITKIIETITNVEIPSWVEGFIKGITGGTSIPTTGEAVKTYNEFAVNQLGNEEVQGVISVKSNGTLDFDEEKFIKEYSEEQQKIVLNWLDENYGEASDIPAMVATTMDPTIKAIEKSIRDTTEDRVEAEQEFSNAQKKKAADIYTQSYGATGLTSIKDYDEATKKISSNLQTQLDLSPEQADALAIETVNTNSDYKISAGKSIIDELEEAGSFTEKELSQFSDELDTLSVSQIDFMAKNIDLINSLKNSGKSSEEILSNLQEQLDVVADEDYIVTIDTVFNGNKNSKEYKEAVSQLFSEENGLGISQEDFELLDEADQKYLLLMERQKALTTLEEDKTSKNQAIEERNKDLDEEITKTQKLIDQKKEERSIAEAENIKGQRSQTWENLQTFDKETAIQLFGFEEGSEELEDFEQQYIATMEHLGDVYQEATAKGEDGFKAVNSALQELEDTPMLDYLDSYNDKMQLNGEYEKTIQNLAKNWNYAGNKLEDYDDQIQDYQDRLRDLELQHEDILDYVPNYVQGMNEAADAIEEQNKVIDDLQTSYQSLQSIMDDYNDDQKISLDNLQALIEMPSEYAAALDIENGQMSINDALMREQLDTKLELQKAQVTAQYLNELEAIANQQLVEANKDTIESELNKQTAIKGVAAAAEEGYQALLKYAQTSTTAFSVDSAAAEQATKAYYNKIQLIDSLSSSSTSELLGSTSSTSSSSSSSSEDEPDEEEYLEREEDLYKAINEQLEEVEATLGRIQTIDEHSWGINSKKALEEENELLKEQMTLYEHKNEVQKSDLADRQAELSAQGITFSDDGSVMTNTEDVLNSLYEEYNAMVDTYNAMNASEQETYKETLEAKKDSIDEIEDAIDSYEDAYNDYNDTLDDLLDTHYAIIENEVKQFTAEVEVHLELAEARNDWVDFWYDVVQDVEDTDFGKLIAKSMEKLDTYVGQEGTILSLTNEANIGLDEVQKQIANADNGGGDSIFGDDTALSKETLSTIRDNLIDAVTAAKEEIDNMSETYLDALDSIQDKLDEQAEGWENIGDHLNHNLEVLKLIDGEMAYDEINNQYQNILDNDEQLLEHRRNAATIWEQEIQKYQELIETTNEATNPELYRTYEQALEKATENYKDAVKDLDSSLESAIKNVQSKRDNLMEKTLDTLDKAISNGIGIDNIDAEWDLLIKDQDMYLDNVERAFNMDDINDAFDELLNTQDSSLSKQQDLLKFRDEELAKLNEKNKLTQYDIDELKARIEIRKQEIALEDAQRNKSNLRLRRDSQGNYTYQYTANEDEIDEAENGIMSAKKDWYELVKSRNKEVRDEIIQNIRDIYDVEKEYSKAIAEGDVATAQSLLRQKEMLLERQKALNAEAGKSTKDFYDGVVTYFEDVNNNTVLPMWQSDVSQMIDKWNNGGEDSFVGAVQAGITQLDSIQQEYLNNTEELFDAAGRSITDYRKDGIDPTTESLEDLQETNDDVNDSVQETIDLMDELGDALGEAEDAYNDLEASAVEAIEKINQTLKTLSETVVSTKKDMEDLSTASKQAATDVQNATNAKNNTTKNTNNTNNNTSSDTKKTSSNIQKYVMGPAINGDPNEWGVYAVTNNGNRREFVENAVTEQIKKKYGDIGFKSGGYTGSWNNGSNENNGKLAFLHQKELVLNESDTSNILNAVNSVRDLVNKDNSSIDHALANSLANAMTTQTRVMAEVGSQMLQAIASSVVNNNQVQNYRNMTVNADFSGVRSADAIYQALMNLDNYASQVAYSNAPDANRSY